MLALAAEGNLVGGAVYRGLVAACATGAGATLITLDARAGTTYRALGCDYRMLL